MASFIILYNFIYRNMENQNINTQKNDNQIQEDQDSANIKFRKVSLQQQADYGPFLKQDIFRDSIRKIDNLKKQIITVDQFGQKSNNYQPNYDFKDSDLQEPKKSQIKVVTLLEKYTHKEQVKRSKGENKDTKICKSNSSVDKCLTFTRFSNKILKSSTSLKEEGECNKGVFQQELTQSGHSKDNNANGQQNTKKEVKKNVRLKTNSVVSLSSALALQRKHKQCIPLEGAPIKQQDDFLYDSYRLRKIVAPVWNELSSVWMREQQMKKSAIKQVRRGKQRKKTIYQGYDFNGKLIPSNDSQNKKKPHCEAPDIQVQFSSQHAVQNLDKYHDRHQRYARTVNKLRISPAADGIAQTSSFLDNFKKLPWHRNVQNVLKNQKHEQEQDKNQPSYHQQSKRSKYLTYHESKHPTYYDESKHPTYYDESKHPTYNESKGHLKQGEQQCKKSKQQKLIQEFQRIKDGQLGQESQIFGYGLSKYVKVKKFHQKQHKSKSYNSCTCKYFTPYSDNSQTDMENQLKIKQTPIRGPQTVKANKRLFRQVFNMSLKHIEAQDRGDLLTAKLIRNDDNLYGQGKNKLIKHEDKQYGQGKNKNQVSPDQTKMRKIRNSDTTLFKKAFDIKPSLFRQIKLAQNQQPFLIQQQEYPQINGKQSRNTFQQNKSQSMIKDGALENDRKSEIIVRNSPALLSKKNLFQGPAKINIHTFKHSRSNQDIEKVFKKTTHKPLKKHSIHENLRQNFV